MIRKLVSEEEEEAAMRSRKRWSWMKKWALVLLVVLPQACINQQPDGSQTTAEEESPKNQPESLPKEKLPKNTVRLEIPHY